MAFSDQDLNMKAGAYPFVKLQDVETDISDKPPLRRADPGDMSKALKDISAKKYAPTQEEEDTPGIRAAMSWLKNYGGPQVSSRGMREVQEGTKDILGRGPSGAEEALRAFRPHAVGRIGELDEEQKELYTRQGQFSEEAISKLEDYESLVSEQQQKGEAKIRDAKLLSIYANGPTDRVLDLQKTIDDNPGSIAARDAQQELDKYSELDPKRALGGLSGIVAAIAIGMGTAGASLTGGPNYALNIINDAIDRDLQAQKSRFQSRRSNYMMEKDLYARQMKSFQDDKVSTMNFLALRNQQVAGYLKGLAGQAQNVLMQEGLVEKASVFERQAQQFELQGQQMLMAGEVNKANIANANANRRMQADKMKISTMAQSVEGGGLANTLPTGVTPVKGKTLTANDVKEIKEVVKEFPPILRHIQELRRLRDTFGAEKIPWSDASQQMDSHMEAIALAMKGKSMDNLGAALTANEKEMQRIAKFGGDVRRIFGPVEKMLKDLEDGFKLDTKNKLKAYNAEWNELSQKNVFNKLAPKVGQ